MLFRIHMQWIEASSKQSRYSSRPICLKYQLSGSQSQISTYKFMWGNSSTLINVITQKSKKSKKDKKDTDVEQVVCTDVTTSLI